MLEEKLRSCFDEMTVYKDLKKSNFFNSLSLPSFMRDWILKKFEDETGYFDVDEVASFVHTYLPKKEDWNLIKDKIVKENQHVKFLAKISTDINIKTGKVSFSLPDFGLANKFTIIEDDVWQKYKKE